MPGQPGSNTNTQIPDFLSMSDEEIANLTQPVSADASGVQTAGGATAANDDSGTAAGSEADTSAAAGAGAGTDPGSAAAPTQKEGDNANGTDKGSPAEGAGGTDGNGTADAGAAAGAAKTGDEGQAAGQAQGAGQAGKDAAAAAKGTEAGAASGQAADGGSAVRTGDAAAGAVTEPGKQIPARSSETQEKTPEFYKSFHDRIMGPIKANGKDLVLKSPEEAIQLMQMGANYTQKMQALAPHRKLILMLGNNDLLNEDRLSFLIDLNKGNPEAIKKLLADHKVDPLEINTQEASKYQSGNHKVSDQEAAFRTVLDDLGSNPDGQKTLQEINDRWDQASKEVLWNNPEIMTLIHEQRSNGIYEAISTEVNRRRTLGVLPAQVSFLQAYKQIGDELAAAGAFNHLGHSGQGTTATSTTAAAATAAATAAAPITRVAAPKTEGVPANAKASAASSPRSAPSQGSGVLRNPLEMSDADIMAMATPK